MRLRLLNSIARFRDDTRGATVVLFGLSLIPVAGLTGAAVDYSRGQWMERKLQNALDSAVLAASQQTTSARSSYATNLFNASKPSIDGSIGTPTWTTNTDGSFSGSVTATLNNKISALVGVPTTHISVASKASQSITDDACILTYGNGIVTTSNTLTFNGSPTVNLSGCSLHSNDSLVCNGNPTNAPHSYATGTASGCNNPVSGAPEIPDIYASIATANLTKECSTNSYNSLSWTPTAAPASTKMVTVTKTDRTEYHVCGTLTLSGSGTLLNTSTSADTLIVVENGALIIDKNAAVTANRTTFVVTATNTSASHIIDFPNGNGQTGSLTLSPSKTSTNPWRGMALYQDPTLTSNIDMTWGPGASLYVDGVIYFPKAALVMHGAGNSNSGGCTKIAVNTFTNNGSFNLTQTTAGCTDIGMQQYSAFGRLLN
jgi:Flp pilus assembly protein TadG